MDINLQDVDGMTALHHAVVSECASLVELLLKNGASVETQSKENLNAMDLANKTSNSDMIRFVSSSF